MKFNLWKFLTSYAYRYAWIVGKSAEKGVKEGINKGIIH